MSLDLVEVEALVRTEMGRLLGRSHRDFDDHVQDVLLAWWQLGWKDELENPTAYIKKMCKNRELDNADLVGHPKMADPLPEERVAEILDGRSFQTVDDALFATAYKAVRDDLSEPIATCWCLVEERGLSTYEAAQYVGLNQSTVHRHVEAARKILAEELADYRDC